MVKGTHTHILTPYSNNINPPFVFVNLTDGGKVGGCEHLQIEKNYMDKKKPNRIPPTDEITTMAGAAGVLT